MDLWHLLTKLLLPVGSEEKGSEKWLERTRRLCDMVTRGKEIALEHLLVRNLRPSGEIPQLPLTIGRPIIRFNKAETAYKRSEREGGREEREKGES